MALMETPQCDFGNQAPDFKLKGVDGHLYTLESVKRENGLLVMFICNHCPYVKAIQDRLPNIVAELHKLNIGVIAINSNDTESYTEDSFENMKIVAEEAGYNFPYCIDETQQVALQYGAVCTPDFFGYNKALQCQYRGRLDSAGRNPASTDTVPELLLAMQQIVETGQGPKEQTPSMGCSIKWR